MLPISLINVLFCRFCAVLVLLIFVLALHTLFSITGSDVGRELDFLSSEAPNASRVQNPTKAVAELTLVEKTCYRHKWPQRRHVRPCGSRRDSIISKRIRSIREAHEPSKEQTEYEHNLVPIAIDLHIESQTGVCGPHRSAAHSFRNLIARISHNHPSLSHSTPSRYLSDDSWRDRRPGDTLLNIDHSPRWLKALLPKSPVRFNPVTRTLSTTRALTTHDSIAGEQPAASTANTQADGTPKVKTEKECTAIYSNTK